MCHESLISQKLFTKKVFKISIRFWSFELIKICHANVFHAEKFIYSQNEVACNPRLKFDENGLLLSVPPLFPPPPPKKK